jgi:hypothetical protein
MDEGERRFIIELRAFAKYLITRDAHFQNWCSPAGVADEGSKIKPKIQSPCVKYGILIVVHRS